MPEEVPIVLNARLIKAYDGRVPRREALSVGNSGFPRAMPRNWTCQVNNGNQLGILLNRMMLLYFCFKSTKMTAV